MKPTPGVWGLDLGQCALKALRLQEVDGTLTATAFDYVEYPKILSQPDADPDQHIIIYTAEPGSPDEAALRRLLCPD